MGVKSRVSPGNLLRKRPTMNLQVIISALLLVLPGLPVTRCQSVEQNRSCKAEREDTIVAEICRGYHNDVSAEDIALKIGNKLIQIGSSHFVMEVPNKWFVTKKDCKESRHNKARIDIDQEAEKISGWDFQVLVNALKSKGWENILVFADGYPTFAGWKQDECHVSMLTNGFRVILFL